MLVTRRRQGVEDKKGDNERKGGASVGKVGRGNHKVRENFRDDGT